MPVVAMSDFIWEDHGNGGKKETTSSFFFLAALHVGSNLYHSIGNSVLTTGPPRKSLTLSLQNSVYR